MSFGEGAGRGCDPHAWLQAPVRSRSSSDHRALPGRLDAGAARRGLRRQPEHGEVAATEGWCPSATLAEAFGLSEATSHPAALVVGWAGSTAGALDSSCTVGLGLLWRSPFEEALHRSGVSLKQTALAPQLA